MPVPLRSILNNANLYEPFLRRLQGVYQAMDEAYGRTARGYGFDCRGCEDNCCRTRFHHHTLAEYLYLLQGYGRLDGNSQRAIRQRAQCYQNDPPRSPGRQRRPGRLCPLNVNGSCSLYDHRPMICRLHGIPYKLRRVGQQPAVGSGCNVFSEQNMGRRYIRFDRTPLYRMMADIEKALRSALGTTRKVKMSIADMLAPKGSDREIY